MADITVTIDSVDRSKLIDRDNRLSYSRDINSQGNAGFVLADTPDGFVPTDGMEVLIKEDGVDRFGGIINGRPRNFRGPDSAKQLTFYQIDVASWELRLNKRRIWRVYTAITFADIVTDINTDFLDGEGITLSVLAGSVQTVTFNGETVAEALDILCALESDGRSWLVSPSKVLTIDVQSATAAPAELNARNVELNRPKPTIQPDRTGYANTITVVGGNHELPILFTARDATEIAARAAVEGGSGIYHDVVEDSEILSANQAEVKAEGILLQRKQIRQRFTAMTRVSGFDIGQQVTVDLPNLGIDEETFFIMNVETAVSPGVRELWHTITAVDGFLDGSWQSEYRRKLPPRTIPMQIEATPGLVRVLPTPGVLIHDPVEIPAQWFQGALSDSLTGGVSGVAISITHQGFGQGGHVIEAGRGPVATPRKSHLEMYAIDADDKPEASPSTIFTWNELNASSFKKSIIVKPDNTTACLIERDGANPIFLVVSLLTGFLGSVSFTGIADNNDYTEGVWVGNHVYWPETGGGSIFIFDVSDPANPVLDNEFATGLSSADSCVPSSDGLFLYATGAGSDVVSIDISDPTAPSISDTQVVTGNYVSLDIDEDDARLFMVARDDASNVRYAVIDVAGGTLTLDVEDTLALSTSMMKGVSLCFFSDSAIAFRERPASTTPNTQEAHVFTVDPVDGVSFVESFTYANDTSSNRGPERSYIGNRVAMKHDGVTAEHQVTFGKPAFDRIVPYEIEAPLRVVFGGTGFKEYTPGNLLVATGVETLGLLAPPVFGDSRLVPDINEPGLMKWVPLPTPIRTIPLTIAAAELLEANVPAVITSAAGWPRVLAFDDTTEEFASWSFVLPIDFDGDPVLRLKGVFRATAATGSLGITVAVMATSDGDPTAADDYDTDNEGVVVVPGTIDDQGTFVVNLANFDGGVAGDKVIILLSRNVAVAGDTVGDVEVGDCWLEYTERMVELGLSRVVEGLFASDNFDRADGAIGADWTVHRGAAPLIASNELQDTPTGAEMQTTLIPSDGLDEMFVQAFARSGDDSVPVGLLGKWSDGSGGYLLQLGTFQDRLRIWYWNGGAFVTLVNSSGAITINDNDEWDVQFYVKDSVQDGWIQKRTGGPIATVTGTHGGFTGTGRGGVHAGTGISVSCEWDDYMVCRSKDVVVRDLPTGFKAKIRDSAGVVVAEATESSGVATIDASMAGGATEVVPFAGWTDIVVTNSTDVTQATFDDIAGIYPGDEYLFTI
jgi:hypothetical protein